MKKMCYLLTMGLLAGSLTVPVFAASDADSASDKKWVIATDTVFKPFEYTDDDGNFVGIDVDVLDAIAKDQGFEYELKSLGWDASIAACQAGQADGMIAGASITDENGFNITYYEDSPTMYQAVLGGQVVACFEDTPIMASSIKDGDLALQILEDTANEGSPYGFAIFDADNQELLDMFNAGLKDIKDSGEYNKIIAKYLGEDAVPTEEADADATETPAAEKEAAE